VERAAMSAALLEVSDSIFESRPSTIEASVERQRQQFVRSVARWKFACDVLGEPSSSSSSSSSRVDDGRAVVSATGVAEASGDSDDEEEEEEEDTGAGAAAAAREVVVASPVKFTVFGYSGCSYAESACRQVKQLAKARPAEVTCECQVNPFFFFVFIV